MRKPDRSCLKLSAYITAHSVKRDFANPKSRKSAIRRLGYMGISKAYVESYRGGLLLQEEHLVEVRDHLLESGFEVSGGIATTHGQGFTEKSSRGYHWACYSSPITLENLERASRVSARVFDEIIIDDFLCTECRCSRCKELRGERTWGELYGDLMYEFSTMRLIAPAREENPEVKLIIKYPQWYDRFHEFGYDVVRQSRAFDSVWVGTEIRDPRVDYVYQYQPFANYTYLRSVAGPKVEGAWFDFLWCYPEIYMEQAYQSVLAGASELILFSYGPDKYGRGNPNAASLVAKKPLLEEICRNLKGKVHLGVEAYKPPGSDPRSEAYIFDYLGLNGLPLLLSSRRPAGSSIFLPVHSLHDPRACHVITDPDKAVSILATSGFLEGFSGNDRVTELFGLSSEPVARKDIFTYRFEVEGDQHQSEESVLFRSYLRNEDARIVASARRGKNYPIFTVNRVDGINYIAACLDTFSYMPRHGESAVTVAEPVSLIHLPQAYLDSLRELLLSPLEISFRAPPMVGLYLYGDGKTEEPSVIILENFGDRSAKVELGTNLELSPPGNMEPFESGDSPLKLEVPGRDLALLTRKKP